MLGMIGIHTCRCEISKVRCPVLIERFTIVPLFAGATLQLPVHAGANLQLPSYRQSVLPIHSCPALIYGTC